MDRRGLIQLILYRYVYVFLTGDAMELRSLGELVQFLVATFLLYLRVSGQFHLICGVLHLFGFRLPETHHLYFLASSFTDFWRRINIYWKDFMMKLVYYPSFFKLKRFGASVALIGATIVVFAGTWLLHSYQWFWLRGGFPLQPQDFMFWGILGGLVVVGALRELRRLTGTQARIRRTTLVVRLSLADGGDLFRHLHPVVAVERRIADVVAAEWSAAANTSVKEVLVLAGLLVLGFRNCRPTLAEPGQRESRADDPASLVQRGPVAEPCRTAGAERPRLVRTGCAGARFGGRRSSALDAQRSRPCASAEGYYENLDNQSRMSAQLWDVTARKPASWIPLGETAAYQERQDFVRGELRPNARVVFNGQTLTTNSWGHARPRARAGEARRTSSGSQCSARRTSWVRALQTTALSRERSNRC
jgi:hypothetical protein